tara:strand:- start:71 stop:505 length:435 start_codon:yes stop_codon:yes gene_type:complete
MDNFQKKTIYLNSSKYKTIVDEIVDLKLFSSNVDLFVFAAGIGFSENISEPIGQGQRGTEIKTDSTDALKNNLGAIRAIALADKQDVSILDDLDECSEIFAGYVNGGLARLEEIRQENPKDIDFIDEILQLLKRQATKNRKSKS